MKIWKNLGSLFARQTTAPGSLNKQAYRENFENQTGLAHTIARKAFTNSRVLTGACLLAFFGQTAHAQSCGLSPNEILWNAGSSAGTADQTATVTFGTATTGVTVSGTLFRGTGSSSMNLNETTAGNGTYAFTFDNDVIHSLGFWAGNLGRRNTGAGDSGIFGNFGITTTSATIQPAPFTFVGATNGIFPGLGGSSNETAAVTTVPGTTIPAIHDPTANGNDDQANGIIAFDYSGPAVVDPTSDTISNFAFDSVGNGIGPSGFFAISAIVKSCVTAADDDFTGTAINTSTGGSTASVFADDDTNDVAASQTNVALTALPLPTPPAAGSISVGADGIISVAVGTSPGTYVVPYQICENHLTSNCDTAEATIVIQADPVAADDTVANPNPGTPTVIDPFADNGNGLDSDADGTLDPTTVALIDPATGNPVTTLAVAGEGTWDVNATSGAVTFTPDALWWVIQHLWHILSLTMRGSSQTKPA